MLRIIGGEWRGRKLPFQEADGLRPTGDRVRETLFNWLQWNVRGSRCLDLFAGSGALGFEAASRGAAQVVLVENNPLTATQLVRNRERLQSETIEVVRADAFVYLRSDTEPFNLVFVDPPFALEQVTEICAALEDSTLLGKNALVYIETPSHQSYEVPVAWSMLKSGKAGQVLARLYSCRSTENKG